MNTQLILCVVIVLIFFVIMFNLCSPKKETFVSSGIVKYPEPLMEEHSKFTYSQSNKDTELISMTHELTKKIQEALFKDETFLKETNFVNFKTKTISQIYKSIYAGAKKYIENYGNINSSFKLSILKLLLQYYDYTMDSQYTDIIKNDSNLNSNELNELIELNDDTCITSCVDGTCSTCDEDTPAERKLKIRFNEIKVKQDNLFTEIILLNEDKSIKFGFYSINKQKRVLERLVDKLLIDIYLSVNGQYLGNLACPLYEENVCPVSGSNSVCQKETDLHNEKNICVNKDTNNYLTSNCEVMNGYGRKMCESTKYLNNGAEESCVYEDLTQKCVNPDTADILEEATQNKATFNKCHEIYNNDLGKMKDKCRYFDKCNYKLAKDIEGNNVGVCYAIKEDDRPANFCLSISGLTNVTDTNPLSKKDPSDDNYDCVEIEAYGSLRLTSGGATFPYFNSSGVDNLECSMFDNSNFERNELDQRSPKNIGNKTYINSNDNLKQMCNGLVDENGSTKCQYVEFNRNIPKSLNSKYSKINMCLPRGISELPNDINPNLTEALCEGKGHIWSDVNKICINPSEGSRAFNHEVYCNQFDNYLWASGASGIDDNQEDFEYGICKDISSSLNKVEDLIDNIHEKHISGLINLDLAKEQVNEMIPNIKNALTSLN